MLRSAEQRAKRQAKLKAKQQAELHAPNLINGSPAVEVLPPVQQQRDVCGRFQKGHTLRHPGCGRPREEFAALARHYTDRYKLLEIASEMAAGQGKFTKIDHPTRLKAIEFVVERGFGHSPAVVELETDRESILIKRIVGVTIEDL